MRSEYSANELRCACLGMMRQLWELWLETTSYQSLTMTITSKDRKRIVEWFESFLDDWNAERNTEVVYNLETADLEDDDFTSESRDYRLCVDERYQDFDAPNFEFEFDPEGTKQEFNGQIEVDMDTDTEEELTSEMQKVSLKSQE